MSEFAEIVDGVVVNTTCVADEVCGEWPESEELGKAFLASIGFMGEYVQHSPIGAFRGKFADIGDMYDPETDQFVRVEVPL